MTAPKRLEIQRQVSRQDRRCRDDLDSGFFRFWGRVGERTHELPACPPGLGGNQLRHVGAEEAQKERSRGARSGV